MAARNDAMELGNGEKIPILYEDRSVLAIDKPRGWMLIPYNWQKTPWNLQAAINSALQEKLFWVRSRGLRFLQYVHRLDAETTGILLFAKSPGAVESYGRLFESRRMEKVYLAVIEGKPPRGEWSCEHKIGRHPREVGKMKIDPREGKPALTHFRVLERRSGRTLIEARPLTGRTHQIRVHLAVSGIPVEGDALYGRAASDAPMGLRAVFLGYQDPFTKKRIRITAREDVFLREFGFEGFSDQAKG